MYGGVCLGDVFFGMYVCVCVRARACVRACMYVCAHCSLVHLSLFFYFFSPGN